MLNACGRQSKPQVEEQFFGAIAGSEKDASGKYILVPDPPRGRPFGGGGVHPLSV